MVYTVMPAPRSGADFVGLQECDPRSLAKIKLLLKAKDRARYALYGIAFKTMQFKTNIVLAFIVMGCIVMACMGLAGIVVSYTVMACIVITYIVMACAPT